VANETTSTSANDYVLAAELLASRILPNFYGHNNAAHMTRFESIAGSPTKAADFPTAGSLSAAGLTEGTDAAFTQYSTGVVTLTVAEAGLVLAITDLLNVSDIVDMGHYAEQAGQALANKVTTDITALSSGFSNSVGSTTVDLTEANILDGIQTLAAAGVPGPYHGILHPQQWRDLAAAVGGTLTPAGTTGSESVAQVTRAFGAEPAFGGGLMDLYGVNWSISSNVPTATAGADRSGMIVSPRYAIGYLEKWPARVEMERDASLRATEIAVTAAYAVGELLDAAGVQVLTDA
jgi:hypothetical protein